MAADNHPIEYLEKNVVLEFKDEIVLANVDMRKQVGVEQWKARKILNSVDNVVLVVIFTHRDKAKAEKFQNQPATYMVN